MSNRKKFFWIVILPLMGSILLSSCTSSKSSEEKAKAPPDVAEVVKNKEAEKSIAESPSQISARKKITAINPSKIHIDSEGHIIVAKDFSYEEMRQLEKVLTELEESGDIRYSREYKEVKDNRGRIISKSENGFVTTYKYAPLVPFPISSKTEKENKGKQEEKQEDRP